MQNHTKALSLFAIVDLVDRWGLWQPQIFFSPINVSNFSPPNGFSFIVVVGPKQGSIVLIAFKKPKYNANGFIKFHVFFFFFFFFFDMSMQG
jgi:hypothetical protein